MKKRACRYHCDLCNLSFETWYRYSTHVSARGHLLKELSAPVTANIQLVVDEPVAQEDTVLGLDDEESGLYTTFQVADTDTDTDTEQEHWQSLELSSDEDASLDCDPPNMNHSSDLTTENLSFFPFPSEIFFLLYSYAHNTARPKVKYTQFYT